jgi:ubiquinone/menaquinone biosynthesis C-methylase UbiE
MNDRVYNHDPHQLRDKARTALLEIDRVVMLSVEHITVKSVLDVGTGTAIFAQAFEQKGMEVAGIDINEQMVAEAKRFVPSGEFRTGSAEKIPFENQSFDLVFLGHVLHESDNPTLALAEAKRVGRKRIVVLEWPYMEQEKGPPLAHRLKPEDITLFAKHAGLRSVQAIPLRYLSLYIMDIT